MNAPSKVAAPTGLALLRQPFPDHQISKLPKETKKQADDRKSEQAKGNWPSKCPVCEGYHHPRAVHLDYVGHAAATDRLLDADPEWDWEPFSVDERGLPAFDNNGGLWIRLTVCGKTRIGYGSADGKTGGDAKKEIIGDAIRNAGMRFGMALDLWHKGQLHLDDDPTGDEPNRKTGVKLDGQFTSITALEKAIKGFVVEMGKVANMEEWYVLKNAHADLLAQAERDHPDWWNGWAGQPDNFTPLRRKIEILEADLEGVPA